MPVFPVSFSNNLEENESTYVEIEGWDDVVELLQASCDESLANEANDDIWIQLKNDLIQDWLAYQRKLFEQQQSHIVEQEQDFQKRLQREHDLATMSEKIASAALVHGTDDDESQQYADIAKQALLTRFGYEDDVDDINDATNANAGNVGDRSSSSKTNEKKASTATMAANSQEKSNKNSSISTVPSKREEQQKTKLQQQQKVAAKEERRKRAIKGERRK